MKKSSVYMSSISCKGIKSPIPFQKPCIYASVSLSGTSQRFKTTVDGKNGENPEWDCQMRFDLTDGQDLFLQIDLTVRIPLIPDIIVGTVHIPVSDLIYGGPGGRISYQVKGSDGKANGTINLWYRSEGFELNSESVAEAYFMPEPTAPPATDFSYKPPLEPYPAYYAPLPNLFPNTYASPLTNPGPMNSIYPPSNPAPYHPPSNSGIYPPQPDSGFGSGTSYYPPSGTHYPPVCKVGESLYYPPVDRVGEPVYYPPPETRYPPLGGNERGCDCRVAYPASNGFYPPPPRYPYY